MASTRSVSAELDAAVLAADPSSSSIALAASHARSATLPGATSSMPDPHGSDITDAMAANEHGRDPLGSGPWWVLVLDRSGDNPRWIIVTVAMSANVRPAEMTDGGRRYAGWEDVTSWVAQTGDLPGKTLAGWLPR